MIRLADLTPRQHSVLEFIVTYQQEHRIAPTVREIADYLGLRSPGGIHRILTVLKEKGYILSDAGKKRAWRFRVPITGKGIPVIGKIAAGQPIEAVENMAEELSISPDVFGCGRCFSLKVQGDSMIDAHIVDGDLAIIRPQQTAENGEIAAVIIHEVPEEATLKRIRRRGKTLILEPANDAYDSLVFKGKDIARVSIIGKLVGVVRKS
ncbi:MAG: transcriptional repressor LexA [Desulfobacteraceae bacterium]|nr:transcriptional repressor LexA [Desulfobacteraceae bacterium]